MNRRSFLGWLGSVLGGSVLGATSLVGKGVVGPDFYNPATENWVPEEPGNYPNQTYYYLYSTGDTHYLDDIHFMAIPNSRWCLEPEQKKALLQMFSKLPSPIVYGPDYIGDFESRHFNWSKL